MTNDIDNYINDFPEPIREILSKIRSLINTEAPEAEERMAYGMPGYYINKKPLIYFAAFKNHIGLYATPAAHEQFKEELSKYKQGKGSVQFPLDEEMPYSLIKKMVQYRLKNL